MTFLGIAASTISRNEAWDFMDLGRHLERADKTTRFLDVSSYLPGGADGLEAISPGILHWTAILRSCGALGAFRAAQRDINAPRRGGFPDLLEGFPALGPLLHREGGHQPAPDLRHAARHVFQRSGARDRPLARRT